MEKMYLQFDYQMQIRYSIPVEQCFYTIKCIPKETSQQRLLEKEIRMEPASRWSLGEDGWKNPKLYGHVQKKHDCFTFGIRGKVEIFPEKYEKEKDEIQIGIYRYPFGKCIPGTGISEYFRSLDLSVCRSNQEKSMKIMNYLHEKFSYVPDKTEAFTTAEEAWRLGMGVCQDFAHIFVTLLRLAGIPSRYVCGLLVGEGASHAWAEAFCEGKWIGLDPANNCLVRDCHIKLGDGRDASECAINRGILLGGGRQSQQVMAVVKKI